MEETQWADALGRVPSGIFVLMVKRGTEISTMMASWVQQASFDPPTLSVAVHKDREIGQSLTDHTSFVLNILAADDKNLFRQFAKGKSEGHDPLQGTSIQTLANGQPFLSDALAYLECRVRTRVDAGDHHLVVGDVLSGRVLREGDPRVHLRKSGLSY